MKTLEEVLGEWRGQAQVLGARGHEREAKNIHEIVDDVKAAAEDYLKFLTEKDAMLRDGKSCSWHRARFAEWEREGHAAKEKGVRYYRQIILPRRANISAAFEEGKRAGKEGLAA